MNASGKAGETERDGRMRINMGPSHPAMHGTIRLALDLEGEYVRGTEVEIGFLHRGFEKTAENRTWNQVVPYTDRLNYVSPLINNVGYVLSVERLMGITVPLRGQFLRVLACELSRVTDHLTCNGAMAMEAGAITVFVYLMNAREAIWHLLEELTGARLTNSYARVGGVTGDVTEPFLKGIPRALADTRKAVKDSTALLEKNRIFYDRARNVGLLTREDAVSYGITGPMGRASGLDYDVRRDQPYLVYDRFDFVIPLGAKGDTWDRFWVRMQEIEQSLSIIEQCIGSLPQGPVGVDDQRVSLPPSPATHTDMESLIRHFKLLMPGHGVRPPAGEAYVPVEGANGELGFFIVSDGTDRPWRVRVRPPCFFPMAAMPKILEGAMVADIIPIFGSVNMIAGELDR